MVVAVGLCPLWRSSEKESVPFDLLPSFTLLPPACVLQLREAETHPARGLLFIGPSAVVSQHLKLLSRIQLIKHSAEPSGRHSKGLVDSIHPPQPPDIWIRYITVLIALKCRAVARVHSLVIIQIQDNSFSVSFDLLILNIYLQFFLISLCT